MAHIHSLIDFVADVFVVFNDKVLLRKHDKYEIWLPFGGHIELHEEPNEAAVREVKEEGGLDVVLVGRVPAVDQDVPGYKELIPPEFMNIHKISETHRHISLVFFARATTDEVKPSGDDRSDAWHWFTEEELLIETEGGPYGVRDSICYYALSALRTLR